MTKSCQLRWPTLCGILAIAGIAAACGSATGPEIRGDPPLQTDELVYQLQRDDYGNLSVEMPYTYHNKTGETVYLVNCNGDVPPSLEKWHDGEWVRAWTPILPLCQSTPIEILSGAVYQDTLLVFAGPQGSNILPQFQVDDLDGTYRLAWHVTRHDYDSDSPPFGTPLPLEDNISNTFELRAP